MRLNKENNDKNSMCHYVVELDSEIILVYKAMLFVPDYKVVVTLTPNKKNAKLGENNNNKVINVIRILNGKIFSTQLISWNPS